MRVWLAVILLAAWLPGQRRFVVDAAGGGQFTDLPQALANARDGDVFDVLPGTYTPATTDKGVRIVGGAGRLLRAGTFTVRGVGRAATFAITGFETELGAALVEFVVDRCDGPVVLQRLTAATFWPWPYLQPGLRLQVASSGAVSAHECAWQGDSAVRVVDTGSYLTLTSSTVAGLGAPPGSFVQAFPGLLQTGGRVDVVDSIVRGADGSSLPRVSGGFGAVVTAGSFRAARSTIEGGWSQAFISMWQEPGFSIAPAATVVVDPTVTFVRGSPPPTVATVPAVGVPSVATGGTLAPAWSGGLGAPCLLDVSLAGPALPSPWGTIHLDPATMSALYVGPAIASPPGITLIAAIPSGVTITLQGAVALPTGVALTTAATFVVR